MKESFKLRKAAQHGNIVIPMQNFMADHTRLPPINSNFSRDTEKHIEDLKNGSSNILVAVRVRPLNSKELTFSNYETLKVLDNKVVVLLDPQNQFDPNDVFRANRNKEKQYAFDYAFDQNDDTSMVFENTTKFLIPGVINGFNATVFAYGATGAGKTYTMLGGQNQPGIMFLTMNELFKQIRNNNEKQFVVKVSYLEVYNETLRDLLSVGEAAIEMREDATKGVIITGITEVTAGSPDEVMTLLSVGSKNRTMEATGANVVSSRSHAVLQVTVEHKEKNQGISEEVTISKLSLIDLAGSERASATNNTGQRMIEGANINKSLLALGNCITLLSEKSGEKGNKIMHIPYRDSKLTRLLKDSLGGNCRTTMIANLSPSAITFEDTHNTLKYANRAKNIKTSVHRNVLHVENHVEKYAQIISDLRQENDHLKQLLHSNLQQPRQYDGLSLSKEVSYDPSYKDMLSNDIKAHFDEEIRLKRKVFDAEIQYDDIEEKVTAMANEANMSEDKAMTRRYEDLLNTKKRLALLVDDAQREYSMLGAKRNFLQARIQKEKNKDIVMFLSSLMKQNQMTIENMELQHREKRIESQVRLKDKQLKVLQNRLANKQGKSKESSQIYEPPSRISHVDSVRLTDEMRVHNDLLEDSASFLNELQEFETTGQVKNLKVMSQAKNIMHLPHINPKVSHGPTTQASRKILPAPVKKLDFGRAINHSSHFPTSSFSPHNNQQFYYNKQEYLIEKQKPFEGNQSDRAKKKKYAYLPLQSQIKKQILGSHRTENSFDTATKQPARGRPNYLTLSPKRTGVQSLTNLSQYSGGTTSSAQTDNKRNILRSLNKRSEGQRSDGALKLRAIHGQGNVAMRYGASPYVYGKPKKP